MRLLPLLAGLLLSACSSPTYTVEGDRIASSHWLDKSILLTFDDGPHDVGIDDAILRTLARHKAKAIWFVNCRNFDAANPHAAENAATLRRIIREGHLVGSHGYDHRDLRKLHGPALAHEVEDCSAAIARIIGERPRYFRPPWGVSTPEADAVIVRSGMRSVLWSLNSYDSLRDSFKANPAEYRAFLASRDMGEAAGDVMLMHDYPNTAATLDAMLSKLEGEGFHFVLPTR